MDNSESDLEAAANRRELLNLTSQLLQSNHDLRRRISILENGPRDEGSSVPSEAGQRTSLISIKSQIRAFEFEHDLKESWVYRKVRRSTSDVSFRSSVALSHAHSALSDISLSDISAISIVALPFCSSDLSNSHYYRQDEEQSEGYGLQQQEEEPTIEPPTLTTGSHPINTLVPLKPPDSIIESKQIGLKSSSRSKLEEDFWVLHWHQFGRGARGRRRQYYYFNKLSGFYTLWDPMTPTRTTMFYLPQVSKDGKLFYYNQATKTRAEKVPSDMMKSQKKICDKYAESLLDQYPYFRYRVTRETQVKPIELAIKNISLTSLSPNTTKQSQRNSKSPRSGSDIIEAPSGDVDLNGQNTLESHTPPTESPSRSTSRSTTAQVLSEKSDTPPADREKRDGVVRGSEKGGSKLVAQTEAGSQGVSTIPSFSVNHSSVVKAPFLREYKLVVVGGGGVDKSGIAIQVTMRYILLHTFFKWSELT